MTFINPETGEMYSSVLDIPCPAPNMKCEQCPYFPSVQGDCLTFCQEHPISAGRLFGYTVVDEENFNPDADEFEVGDFVRFSHAMPIRIQNMGLHQEAIGTVQKVDKEGYRCFVVWKDCRRASAWFHNSLLVKVLSPDYSFLSKVLSPDSPNS